MSAVEDVVDASRCGPCGGKCCMLYKPAHEGGLMLLICEDFTAYCERWWQAFGDCGALTSGVPWSHNPLESHATGQDALRRELADAGVDIQACQYHGPAGCRLPRAVRPDVCRAYACWVYGPVQIRSRRPRPSLDDDPSWSFRSLLDS